MGGSASRSSSSTGRRFFATSSSPGSFFGRVTTGTLILNQIARRGSPKERRPGRESRMSTDGAAPAPGRWAILTRRLSRAYGDFYALAELDLEVGRGCLFALLGPNGAGKSTTISILTTLLAPTSGEAFVAGYD